MNTLTEEILRLSMTHVYVLGLGSHCFSQVQTILDRLKEEHGFQRTNGFYFWNGIHRVNGVSFPYDHVIGLNHLDPWAINLHTLWHEEAHYLDRNSPLNFIGSEIYAEQYALYKSYKLSQDTGINGPLRHGIDKVRGWSKSEGIWGDIGGDIVSTKLWSEITGQLVLTNV